MSSPRGPLGRFHAVILAGGRGTRFWPRSRRQTPKQLLPVVGRSSLLQQTTLRLAPLAPPDRIWVIANQQLRSAIRRQLPDVPPEQIIAEPEGRNTAPAIALAARLVGDRDPKAVMGIFPSDHLIGNEKAFLGVLRRAVRAAAKQKSLFVLGLQPTWPETGYGYIEFPKGTAAGEKDPVKVVRFREKPKRPAAERFVRAGNFFWNSGMFVWSVAALREALDQHMPETARAINALPELGSKRFRSALRKQYPLCKSTSIDYGLLERADNIMGFPCVDFGWNDVGSWQAAYSLAHKDPQGNALLSPAELLASSGNYVDAPGKLVALAGVKDLIVVDTPDALLICRRREAQKVSALVKALEASGWNQLL